MKKCPTCVDQRTTTSTEPEYTDDGSGGLVWYCDREVEYTIDEPVRYPDEQVYCDRCNKQLIDDPPPAPPVVSPPPPARAPINLESASTSRLQSYRPNRSSSNLPDEHRANWPLRFFFGLCVAVAAGITFYELTRGQISPPPLTGTTDPPPKQPPLIRDPVNQMTSPTFLESFDNAPDYSNNWNLGWNHGGSTLTYTPGYIRIEASRASSSPSSIGLLSRRVFSGDIDVSVKFNHQGFGQTKVGLFGPGGEGEPALWFDLDTDDVACLWLSHGIPNRVCPSSPYMNRWVTLRIKVLGSQASFYADDALLQTVPFPNPPSAYRIGFGASSVSWKSGDNDTSFASVLVRAERGDPSNQTAVDVGDGRRIAEAKEAAAKAVSTFVSSCAVESSFGSPNEATQAVSISITNSRLEQTRLYWLNQQGRRVLYATLESSSSVNQPTYAGHPWVVTDSNGRCVMLFIAGRASRQDVTIQ